MGLPHKDAGEHIWCPCWVVEQQPLTQSLFMEQASAQSPPLPKSTQYPWLFWKLQHCPFSVQDWLLAVQAPPSPPEDPTTLPLTVHA